MRINVTLDVMMARRKVKGRDLAEQIGITEQNLSLLKSGKVKGVRFETLAKLCAALECQPGDLFEAIDDGLLFVQIVDVLGKAARMLALYARCMFTRFVIAPTPVPIIIPIAIPGQIGGAGSCDPLRFRGPIAVRIGRGSIVAGFGVSARSVTGIGRVIRGNPNQIDVVMSCTVPTEVRDSRNDIIDTRPGDLRGT